MAHVHKPIKMSAAEIEAAVHASDREPFREILALFLNAAPTCKAIQAFANKHPDRWVQALVMLARLCGYTEELTTGAPVAVHIAQLSDAELLARLAALTAMERPTASLHADNGSIRIDGVAAQMLANAGQRLEATRVAP